MNEERTALEQMEWEGGANETFEQGSLMEGCRKPTEEDGRNAARNLKGFQPEDIADTESRRAEFDGLQKREWCYAGQPISYGIPGCKCGNENCVYSEYKDRLWCEKCQIDFEPEYWGVFDGPLIFEMCQLLGMNFDRIDLVNERYIAYDGKHDENGRAG